MSSFDPFEDMRRALDALRPALDQFDQIERSLRDATISMPVHEAIMELERSRERLLLAPDVSAGALALAASARPITIDFRQLAPRIDFIDIADVLARVNLGIGSARFLGEIQFSDAKPASESEENAPDRDSAEDPLVRLVPAEALERLKRVEFAPLRLLDRALRDPEIMRRLDPRQFEGFIAALVDGLGFEDVVLTPASGDGGRDILATKTIHGIPIMFAFECKKYAPDNRVGVDVARALLGTITHGGTRATKGVLVTTSHFTLGARTFIVTEPNLDGKDFDDIVAWLHEYGTKNRPTS